MPTILLALVLLVSGVAKIADRETSAQAFTSLRLPPVLQRLKAPQLLPFGEIALALGLVLVPGPLSVVINACAVALFVAYLVVIVRALSFDEPVTCSCFGRLGLGSVDRFTAVRNLVLVALAVLSFVEAVRGPSTFDRLLDFDGRDWAWLAGVLVAVVLTWLISGHRGADETTAAPVTTDGDGDYLRVPIPFVQVKTPQDASVTLREMALTEPVLLLLVSPTCGSCHDVIAHARTWQRTVPALRTCLVLPMSPVEDVPMLENPSDFDLLFDSNLDAARTFGVGNPSAVLLGADGKLAGGPVVGTQDVIAFMGDIAEQLHGADTDSHEDVSDDAAGRPSAETAASVAPASPGSSHSPASSNPPAHVADPADGDDDGLLDYLPVPTPFALFEDATGTSTSLRQIGAAGPAIFLYVSPGCGPCVQTMEAAPQWQERLGDIPVHYVVTSEPQAQIVVDRGIAPERVLVDEPMALLQMMQLSTPSMFAVGPTQELIAGPVRGYDAIADTMEEILVEVGHARPETSEATDTTATLVTNESASQDGSVAATTTPTPDMVPDVALEDARGETVTAPDALAGERTLVIFLSPGCDACRDVASRIEKWRDQLPQWRLVTVVPNAADDFAADLYAPGVRPDLFDVSLALGEALAIETPALVTIESGRITREPARSQAECYALIRRLRSADLD